MYKTSRVACIYLFILVAKLLDYNVFNYRAQQLKQGHGELEPISAVVGKKHSTHWTSCI